jgi:hypothetical protein
MDKHMIHIDDLVRQRLGGGQEPERPGAWLSMKELLDKEMPVAAAGRSRRRIIGYFTGLLLLATASVGGYQLYTNYNDAGAGVAAGNSAGGSRSVPGSTSGAAGSHNGVQTSIPSDIQLNSTVNPGDNAGSIATTNNQSNANSGNHNSAGSLNHTTAPSVQDISADGGRTNTQRIASVRPAARRRQPHTGSSVSIAASNRDRSSTAVASTSAGNNRPRRNNAGAETVRSRRMSARQATDLSASSDRIFASSGGSRVPGRRSDMNAAPLRPGSNANPGPGSAGATGGPATTPPPVRYEYDTIMSIELVTRRVYDAMTQKFIFRPDTLPKRKIIVARVAPAIDPVPADGGSKSGMRGGHGSKQRNAGKATGDEIASNGAGTHNENPLNAPGSGSGSNGKMDQSDESKNLGAGEESRSSAWKFNLWDAQKFDEAIDKFKISMSRIQMYPGIMAGINASIFTPNSLGGFQVGLTSLFVLNDWWSLVAELRYLHRYNTGSSIRDNYMNIVPGSTAVNPMTINGQPYKEYLWTDQHVDHYFNYDVVRTFEMPLAMRYNSGRFYSMGGLNLVYGMKIDAAEVTRPVDEFKPHREVRPVKTQTNEPFITNTSPLVRMSDFGSRFGTGYVIGCGYMFTPAMHLDFRVTQTFWDNAKTAGARQVSNDLLRTPSVQLSLGYRFGQK